MQKPITHYSPLITPESRQVQATEAQVFPSSFDSILFWDGTVPAVTTPAIEADRKQSEREYKELGGVK
jgi:hypothetical protein